MPTRYSRWIGARATRLALSLALTGAAVATAQRSTPPPPPQPLAPPAGWAPTVPAGFRVNLYADGLSHPRWLAVAPNGDVFVANTLPDGDVVVLHGEATALRRSVFAAHLRRPFGIALHQNYVYVAEETQVVRFRYDPKSSQRLGPAEPVLALPAGGHETTRSLVISPDGQRMYVSAGDFSDHGELAEPGFPFPGDPRRGAVSVSDLDGKNPRLFASGLRNPVGLAFNPASGQLWATNVNTDGLGNLPNDFFTGLSASAFYGWPWSYLAGHVDPRIKPPRPDLVAKALPPAVLFPAHSIPLLLAFYTARQFPAAFRGGAFIAEHGPGNAEQGRGYQVAFVPFHGAQPSGPPQPFMTGFAAPPGGRAAYGHPVGVVVAADGSLLISDDFTNRIWRIRYQP